MKVILVSPGWPAKAFANGIASYIGNLREGLNAEGVDSWVFAQALGSDDVDQQVSNLKETATPQRSSRLLRTLFERIGFRAKNNSWTAEVSERAAQAVVTAFNNLPHTYQPDLIEMDDAFGVSALVAPQINVPIVVRLHGPYFLTGPAMGAQRDDAYFHRLELEREAIVNAHGLTAPSLDLLQRVRQEYAVSLEHAKVIPNPAPSVASSNVWDPGSRDPNLVLFVGRFDRHKGGDLAIEAFVRLAMERPSLRLAFVGPDHNYSTNDGRPLDLEGFLRETITDESIRSRFEFHGQLASSEIMPLRQKAAVTLVASRWENFPMTVLEALAHGSPLVAPATGGITEILAHEENGLLYEPENVEAIASSVARMLDSPELSARCSRAGIETIRNNFSIEVVARQTRDYYASLLRTRT